MGMDITMRLTHNGRILCEELFEGRNSGWFNDLMGVGYKTEYNELPILSCNLPEYARDEEKKWEKEHVIFGTRVMNALEYVDWFYKYEPHKDAGWFTHYDVYRYQRKGWNPFDEGIMHHLTEEDVVADMVFMEVENPYSCDKMVVDKLEKDYSRDELANCEIYFYFDN